MTQDDKKAAALAVYKAATQELYRTGEIFTKLCEQEFGKNAGDYRYIREYFTPEIRAASNAYIEAQNKFYAAGEAYRNAA